MSSVDTKERILNAAERLFGEHGFAGTSLRAITKEAGVNLAAIHYHFGSKEALLLEALHRYAAPVNQQRLQLLQEVEDALEVWPESHWPGFALRQADVFQSYTAW